MTPNNTENVLAYRYKELIIDLKAGKYNKGFLRRLIGAENYESLQKHLEQTTVALDEENKSILLVK